MNFLSSLSLPKNRSNSQAPAGGALEDAAYGEYCRLRAAGEVVDTAEFCRRYPTSIRAALAEVIQVHEWLDHEPELLDDAPGDWPAVGGLWEGFELVEELGRGAFARVFLAREPDLGNRLVVVKVTTLGPGEAATLGSLDHPHIVPIHYQRALPESGLTLVCMPYLGQATLQHVLNRVHGLPAPPHRAAAILDACRDPRLPAENVSGLSPGKTYADGLRTIAAQIAEALAYLHARGLCHRDVKPSNILLQPDGRPRLLDFNLSIDTPSLGQLRLAGTMRYMAPEQLQQEDPTILLTARIDVFALGVVLYEWLTGAHPSGPLPVAKDPELLRQHLLQRQKAGPPRAADLANADRGLARLIERCLAYRPEDRPSAADVARELQRQLRPVRRGLRLLERHAYATACAAALLVVGLAVGSYQVAVRPPRHLLAFELGSQAYQAGEARQAWEHFGIALAEGGKEADCLLARARASLHLGEQDSNWYSLAMHDLKQAQACQPCGLHLAGMGYCAQRMNLPDLAQLYYQQALTYDFSAAAAVHHNLGCLCLNRAKLTPARQHLEQALARDDGLALTHTMLAFTLFREQLKQPSSDVMPEGLQRALHHLERGSLSISGASLQQALWTTHIYACAARYDDRHLPQASAWLAQTLAAGGDPKSLREDPFLRRLLADGLGQAVLDAPSNPPGAGRWEPLINPLQ